MITVCSCTVYRREPGFSHPLLMTIIGLVIMIFAEYIRKFNLFIFFIRLVLHLYSKFLISLLHHFFNVGSEDLFGDGDSAANEAARYENAAEDELTETRAALAEALRNRSHPTVRNPSSQSVPAESGPHTGEVGPHSPIGNHSGAIAELLSEDQHTYDLHFPAECADMPPPNSLACSIQPKNSVTSDATTASGRPRSGGDTIAGSSTDSAVGDSAEEGGRSQDRRLRFDTRS